MDANDDCRCRFAGASRASEFPVVVDDRVVETCLHALQNEMSVCAHSGTRRRSDAAYCIWSIDDFGQGTWPAAGATGPRSNDTVSQASCLERGQGSLSRPGGSLVRLGWSSAGQASTLILQGDGPL